jgi:hypothetical protein
LKRALALLLLAAGCYDPVHVDAVAALGPEAPNVEPSAAHRPGQQCTTCHGGEGPAEREFVAAGTVYTVRGGTTPLRGAIVTVRDATGVSRSAETNDVGNFFIPRSEWSPSFPLRVVLEAEDVRREMVSNIGRNGGCAGCHRGAGDSSFVPGVYLREM